jgi:hypothetical protein
MMIPIDISCFGWLKHQGGYVAGLPRAVCFHETYFHSSILFTICGERILIEISAAAGATYQKI